MNRIINFVFLFILTGIGQILAQKKISLEAPDKRIVFSFDLVNGSPEYSVRFNNRALIEHSPLSLSFEHNDAWGVNLMAERAVFTNGEDNYTLPAGKTSRVHDIYKEVSIPLRERSGKKRLIILRVRAFDDGLAFRYEFPVQDNWTAYTLTDENTCFNLMDNPTARVAFLENFTTSHEHRYHVLPLKDIQNDTLMDMPALFEFPRKTYMAITEANLVNYGGMSLIKRRGMLQSQLSPLPGQT
ncbi:MAG: glycoside hydrolase family 97 N-terminal domain-containing protein, partial [Bacteroidota bacterium]|nr:glycoside hydrolase family 97 N-terminal domain-containing protein [Bacteroidota bacterium]